MATWGHGDMATPLGRPLYTYPTAEQMLLLNFLICSLFSAEWLEYLKCKSVHGINTVWKRANNFKTSHIRQKM